MMSQARITLLGVSLTFILSACGDMSRDSLGGSGQGSNAATEIPAVQPMDSTLSVINQALSDSENAINVLGACPTTRSACTANVRTVNYSDCDVGNLKANGIAVLTYDSNATCATATTATPSSGTVSRTTTGIVYSETGGVTTRVTSDNAANYLGTTIGGGTQVTFVSAAQQTLKINGLQRVRSNSSGTPVVNHSIRTTTDIGISGSRAAGNRTIGSGTVEVFNNIDRYTSTVTFTNLVWGSAGCCYPTSGILTANVALSSPVTVRMIFSSSGVCGQSNVEVTTSNGTTQAPILLRNCE